MAVWAGCRAPQPQGTPEADAGREPGSEGREESGDESWRELEPFEQALELAVQGLVGGIPYEELGRSSLRKTQLLYLAEQQRVELAAKVHIDLKMTEVSGRELARNKRLQDEGDPKDKRSDEEKAQDKADAERGPEMLKDYRLSLAFQSWAPQHKAAHVRRYGWPGQEAAERAKPYAGMTSEVAREMLELLDLGKLDERFSGFWEQVPDDVTDRLKASLKE